MNQIALKTLTNFGEIMAITETRIEIPVFRIENHDDFKALKNDSVFLDQFGRLFVKKFNDIYLLLLMPDEILEERG